MKLTLDFFSIGQSFRTLSVRQGCRDAVPLGAIFQRNGLDIASRVVRAVVTD